MKRPIACIGFGVLTAAAAAALFHADPIAVMAVCAFLAAVLFCLRQFFGKKTACAAAFFLSAAVMAGVYFCADTFWRQPIIDKYDGQEISFDGIIIDTPYTQGTLTYFTVKTTAINGEPARLKIKVSSNMLPWGGIYDCVSGNCMLRTVNYDDSYIDRTSYYNARHIFLETFISKYDKYRVEYTANESPPLMKKLVELREYVITKLFMYLSYDEAALCSAVFTGQRQYLDKDLVRGFRGIGILHILVVSGMHLAIAANFALTLADMLTNNKYLAGIFRLLTVTSFALMTGFGFSVRRALIIFCVAILAEILGNSTDELSSLGLAAILLCTDPFVGGDIGLLWSFTAAAAQIIPGKKINLLLCDVFGAKGKFARAALSLISSTLAGMIGSLPLVLMFVGVISPYSIAANLLIIPVTGVMMVCSGLSAFGALPAAIAGAAARYTLTVVGSLSSMPFAFIVVRDKYYLYIVVIAAAILCFVYYVTGKVNAVKYSAAIVGISVCCAIAFRMLYNSNKYEVKIINMNDGMSAVIYMPDGYAIAACAGDAGLYGEMGELITKYDSPKFMIDISANGHADDYGKRLAYDYFPDVIFTDSENSRIREYSRYEYRGGKVITAGDEFSYQFGGRIDVARYGDTVCTLIELDGVDVLLCEGSCDEIPSGKYSPDIVVTDCDIADNNVFGDDTIAAVIAEEQDLAEIEIRSDEMSYCIRRKDERR